MKGSLRISGILCGLVIAVLLYGCGGGGGSGSPGSKSSEDTGVKLDAMVIPQYQGENTSSVDVFQDVCDPGPPPEFEVFTDHSAELRIEARLVNPNTTFRPGTLYVEKYTVEYRRSEDSIGAPPILTDTRFETIVITPPSGNGTTVTTDSVILVDLIRKGKYASDIQSGQFNSGLAYINNYTAIYTFEGQNEFGDDFSFKAQTNFQIGWFDYCD